MRTACFIRVQPESIRGWTPFVACGTHPHRAEACAWSGPGAGRRTHSCRAKSRHCSAIGKCCKHAHDDTLASFPTAPLYFRVRFTARRCGSHLRFRAVALRRPQTVETVRNVCARPKSPKAAMLRISARTSQ